MSDIIKKGSDEILKGIVDLDDVQQDINTVFQEYELYAYDSRNVLIGQWNYPGGKTGYTDIVLNTTNDAIVYLSGTKTTDKATGNIRWKIIYSKTNSGFEDSSQDRIQEKYFGYLE